jgi:predicted TIM-barrel fold metal-dependent hydrolase
VSTSSPGGPTAGPVGPPRIADFHSHYLGPRPAVAPVNATAELLRSWERVARQVADLDALLAGMDEAGLDLRVLSAPPSMLTPAGQPIAPALVTAVNDHLAAAVARDPRRLAGLATVDLFGGESAAEEVTRVRRLGLAGIVVDCARDDLLPDAASCRPVLAAAAEHGLPVFVHPVSPRRLSADLSRLGRPGTSLARGTANGAALLAVLASGLLDELPGLRLVFPMLGATGLLIAAATPLVERFGVNAPADQRWHIHVDTMGFAPAAIRFAVELLGADHVLNGSDWPVADRVADRARVTGALARAGLRPDQQRLVAYDNAARLLGLTTSA